MAWGSAGVAALAAALVLAAPALGAFPGQNGKIAFQTGGNTIFNPGTTIQVMNADGTGRATLTTGSDPAWSPDGARIAFLRSDGLYVAAADGSGATLIVPSTLEMHSPTWSPDGTRLAFVIEGDCDPHVPSCSASNLFITNSDGTGVQEVVTGVHRPAEPSWSPDGTRFVALDDGEPENSPRIFTINVDGSGLSFITSGINSLTEHPAWAPDASRILYSRIVFGTPPSNQTHQTIAVLPDGSGPEPNGAATVVYPSYAHFPGAWAPDRSRIALSICRPVGNACSTDLFLVNPDGSDVVQLTDDDLAEGNPDWQPIPVNAYPRPKGASPTDVPLVPAYEPCTAPNRTHGPPLAFPSCAPPTQKPGQLTVGTPDANGQPAKLRANIRINPLRGLPSTSQDEADVRLRATINDVRLRSDLSDYTGDLEVRLTVQITDGDNTPHPGGPGPATVQELTHSHPLPCSTTPGDATVGSTCQFDTTVEAVVPGAVKELTRGIWELKKIAVHDGAGNLFMTQGVFVP